MDNKLTKSTSLENRTVSSDESDILSKSSEHGNDRLWTTISTSVKITKRATSVARKSKEISKKSRLREKGDCDDSKSSSHTQYYKQKQYTPEVYDKITSDQYVGITSSDSGSSDTFHCKHPEGRTFSEKTILRRYLEKKIDPIPISEYCCHSLKASQILIGTIICIEKVCYKL